MNKLGCYGVENSLLGDGQKFRERKDSDAGETFYFLLNFLAHISITVSWNAMMQVLALAAVSAGVEDWTALA